MNKQHTQVIDQQGYSFYVHNIVSLHPITQYFDTPETTRWSFIVVLVGQETIELSFDTDKEANDVRYEIYCDMVTWASVGKQIS
jgi:hypothetical protein